MDNTSSQIGCATSFSHTLSNCTTSHDVANAVKKRILLSARTGAMPQDQPPVTFDERECCDYIVNTLGQREQIPALLNIYHGTETMLEELDDRYGPSHRQECIAAIERHLRMQDTEKADRVLWRQWRADFVETEVRYTTLACSQSNPEY